MQFGVGLPIPAVTVNPNEHGQGLPMGIQDQHQPIQFGLGAPNSPVPPVNRNVYGLLNQATQVQQIPQNVWDVDAISAATTL